MAEEQVENQFFDKEKPDTGTGLFKPYKPMSTPVKAAIAIGALGVFGAIVFITSRSEEAALWVMNPGPDSVHLEVAGEPQDLEAGKLLDAKVAVEAGFELGAFRGAQGEDIKVELKPASEHVALVDLGADAAYVVVDISSLYGEDKGSKPMAIAYVSKPAKVHDLPYPALRLVRPGRAVPDKDSWEIKAAQGGKPTAEIYKVFRVDAKRLDDQAKLLEALTAAINSHNTTESENMRTTVNAPPSGEPAPAPTP